MFSLPNSLQCRPSPVFPKNYTALTCAFPRVNREGIVFYFLCNKMLTILQIHLYGQKNSFLMKLESQLSNTTKQTTDRTGEYVNLQMKCSYGKKLYNWEAASSTTKYFRIIKNGTITAIATLPSYISFSGLFSLTDLPFLTAMPPYFLPS